LARSMESPAKNKILSFNDLADKVAELKRAGKVVVQSHGIFDLIHPGIIAHLNSARKQGDILIVTVVKDKDVRRGPGRPIFPENLRVDNVASLEQVDYACVVDDEAPYECVKRIMPDVLAKGQAYKERDRNIHAKIFEEERDLYFGKSRIYETGGFSFSSSLLIKDMLSIYSDETRMFLKDFSKRYSFHDILEKINDLKTLKVLLVGDGIIDEYHYCEPVGKSAKSPIIVNKYLSHDVFAGGAFAIANHLASFCDNVELVSLLGRGDSKEAFIRSSLRPNVKTQFFYRNDGPVVLKKRYVHQYSNQKLLEVDYFNDSYINGSLESAIVDYLKSAIPSYDVVLVSDFGHGFITGAIIEAIERTSARFAVNTQTNGANAGYNLITKYHHPAYVCLDEPEVRLATCDKYADIEGIAKTLAKTIDSDYLIVTRGRNGSIGINRGSEINRTPVFSTKVVDTVGAGDAFFAWTAPCIPREIPLDLVSFIGNAVGALAVRVVCNKKPVERYELLEFIYALLK